jgi:CBS domain-containing protein
MNATATPVRALPESIWSIPAADLMTPNPASIGEDVSVREAVRFLTDKGFSAAPVINDAGRPVGVLSRADLIAHEREMADFVRPRDDANTREEVEVRPADPSRVRDLMSPFVLVVDPTTPADAVARQMVAFRVHRLFVVDGNGVLVGVISALDLLRHMHPPAPVTPGQPRTAYHED